MSCFVLLDLMLDDVIASGSSASAAPGTASGVMGSRRGPGVVRPCLSPGPPHDVGTYSLLALRGSLTLSPWGEGQESLGRWAPCHPKGLCSAECPSLQHFSEGPPSLARPPRWELPSPCSLSHSGSSSCVTPFDYYSCKSPLLLLSEGATLIQASRMRGAERERICFKNVTMNN